MRSLARVAAVLPVVGLVALSCNSSQWQGPDLEARGAALIALPGGDNGTNGAGPAALFICGDPNGQAGTDWDCGAATVTSQATLATALTPPAAAFDTSAQGPAFHYVYSWALGNEINLWNYVGAGAIQNRGVFFNDGTAGSPTDLDVSSLAEGSNPINFGGAFTGFIAIPPAGSDTIKTFAIGSNDGHYFAVQGCASANGTSCDSAALANYVDDDTNSTHALTFRVKKVVFPASGGLFPFTVGWYNGGGQSALELAWAPGSVTTPPTVDSDGTPHANGFTLVPASAIYAPDVHATLTVPAGTNIGGSGGTVTYTAVVVNRGRAPAFAKATTGDAGPTFVLNLLAAQIGAAAITATVNGAAVTPTVTTSGTVKLVSLSFGSPSSASQLLPGAANAATITITVPISSSVQNTDKVNAQGVVRAQATEPAFMEATLKAPQTIWVLTNSPISDDGNDRGNAPPMTGQTNEGGAGSTVTFVSGAVANGDDDKTAFTIGTADPAAATIAQPAAIVGTGLPTSFSGTSSGTSVSAVLNGIAQAQCVAGTGTGGAWSWNAGLGTCACTSAVSSNNWACKQLALADCASGNCYTLVVGRSDAAGDLGPFTTLAFGTAPPTTTLTAPAAGTLKTHALKPAGVASSGIANVAGLTVVGVVSTPGGAQVASCTATSTAGGAWTCSATPAFAPSDGSFNVTAHVVEANGASGASTAAVAVVLDTKPTITAPASNSVINTATATATVTFSGGKQGDGTGVRVCTTATICAPAAQICQATVTAGATTWTCNGSVAASGTPYTFYAYEIDTNGGASDASTAPVTNILVTNTAATVNVANNAVFNFASGTSLALNGTCVTGDNVTAAFLNGSAAWPTGPTQVKCGPVACTAGAWSCTATLPTTTSATGLTLRISQSNGSGSTPNLDVTGITVDLIKPPAVVITSPTEGAKIKAGAGLNPPVIGGTGEAGDKVTLTITRTQGGTVSCNGTPVVSGGGNWTCDVGTTPLADGDYTISLSQTDAAGNPQATATADRHFSIDQTPPAKLTINPIGNANGFIGIPGTLPTITGTGAEAGASLVVTVTNGTTTRTCNIASVPSNGAWSCNTWTPTTNFPAGNYTATAVQTDSFTNPSTASDPVTFTVDLTVPLAPSIDAPANSSFVTTATIAIKSTPAEANGALNITLTDTTTTTVVTTCALAIGSSATQQTCNSTGSLVNGDLYAITSQQVDRAGNAGATATSTFTVDLGRSPTPVINQPTTPTSTTLPVFTGSGFPGSSVTVKTLTPTPSKTLCTVASVTGTTTNGVHAWTCTSTVALDDLDYTIGATSTAAGAAASNTVTLQVRSLPTPTLTSPATTTETKPTFSIAVGAGTAGKTVTVFDGATAICSATITTAPGTVSCLPGNYLGSASLAIGAHSLTAAIADGNNPPHRSLPSAAVATAVLPASPQLTAAATFGTNQPLLAGTGATPGAAITIRSAADASVLCTTTAAADGSYSCQVGASPAGISLPDGNDAVTVEAALNGQTSPATAATVAIQARPAMAPLTTPTKNPTPALCVVPAAGVPAGSTVHVLEGATTICSAAAQTSGQTCCPPGTALAEGTHLLTATVTFPPGGTSAASDAVELRIKTRTDVPTFSGPGGGATVKGDVVVTGKAEPGVSVAVSVDGGAPITVTAGSDGTWSADAGTLNTGAHSVVAVATDSLGNTATSANPLTFSVGLGGQIRGATTGCASTSSSGGSAWPLLALLFLIAPKVRRALGRKPEAGSRKPFGRAATALVAALLLLAPAARAQSIGLEHFKPASGGDGLFGLEGARPPIAEDPALQVRVWMQGLSKPLVFLPDGGGEKSLISSRIGGWLSAQLHAAGNFSVAAQLPFLVSQQGDLSPLPRDVAGGATLGGGLGDLRLTGRLGVLRQGRSPVDLSAQLSVDLPTAASDRFLGDGTVQGEALLATGRRIELTSSAIDVLGNVFVRVRPSRELFGIKEGSEVGLRGGVAFLPESTHPAVPARILAEVEGASFLRAGFAGGSVPAEWRAGLTYCVGRAFAFDFGAGGGLSSGIGAPAFRVLGAISFGSPACGQSIRTDPVPMRPRLVQTSAPSRPAAPPPEAVVAPPMVAEAPPSLDASPPAAPAPAESTRKRTGPKKKVAAAEAPPSLDAMPPSLDAAPPPASQQKTAELPALPDLELAPPSDAPAKKEKKLAMAAPPELPSLDLPLPAAMPKPRGTNLAVLGTNRIELIRPINFQGSSARLANEGRRVLDDVAKLLALNPEVRIEVAGHADTDANGGLAQARANVVAAYLRSKGVSGERLTVESYGASQPMVVGRSRSARAKNLRVELNLLKK